MQEKNQFHAIRITRENGAAFYPYVIDGHIEWVLKRGVLGIGLLNAQGMACGAAIMRPAHNKAASGMELASFYIDEQIRGQGAGKYLLNASKFLCAKLKQPRLSATYPYPKLREIEDLLLNTGFVLLAEGGQIYRMSVAEAAKSSFSKLFGQNIRRVCNLSRQQKVAWQSRFGRDIPEEMSPAKLEGEYLPDASTVYLDEQGQVKAFALCSRLSDGSLFLGEMHAMPGCGSLLAQVFSGVLDALEEAYPDGTLCFAAVNDAGRQIAGRLSAQCEESMTLQIVHTAVWDAPKDNDTGKGLNMPFTIGYEALMPRLNTLSVTLSEAGRANDVLLRSDALPCILSTAQDGTQFQFTYIPANGLGGESYFLNATAQLPMPEMQSGNSFCFRFNAESRVAQANFDMLSHQVIMRAVLPEAMLPTQVEPLRFFVDSFEQDVLEIMRLYREAVAEN